MSVTSLKERLLYTYLRGMRIQSLLEDMGEIGLRSHRLEKFVVVLLC
jgi:hypothetical protein